MTGIHIPPEAVEAAARAFYEAIVKHPNSSGAKAPNWYKVSASDKQAMRDVATAAIRAALAAWPGMEHDPGAIVTDWHRDPAKIILPLTTENPDAEA